MNEFLYEYLKQDNDTEKYDNKLERLDNIVFDESSFQIKNAINFLENNSIKHNSNHNDLKKRKRTNRYMMIKAYNMMSNMDKNINNNNNNNQILTMIRMPDVFKNILTNNNDDGKNENKNKNKSESESESENKSIVEKDVNNEYVEIVKKIQNLENIVNKEFQLLEMGKNKINIKHRDYTLHKKKRYTEEFLKLIIDLIYKIYKNNVKVERYITNDYKIHTIFHKDKKIEVTKYKQCNRCRNGFLSVKGNRLKVITAILCNCNYGVVQAKTCITCSILIYLGVEKNSFSIKGDDGNFYYKNRINVLDENDNFIKKKCNICDVEYTLKDLFLIDNIFTPKKKKNKKK